MTEEKFREILLEGNLGKLKKTDLLELLEEIPERNKLMEENFESNMKTIGEYQKFIKELRGLHDKHTGEIQRLSKIIVAKENQQKILWSVIVALILLLILTIAL